jgi:hypothetical protein
MYIEIDVQMITLLKDKDKRNVPYGECFYLGGVSSA